MNIIDKFGNIVGTEAMKDPKKARRLLLTGYRMQEKKLQLFLTRTAGIRTVCGEDHRVKEHH